MSISALSITGTYAILKGNKMFKFDPRIEDLSKKFFLGVEWHPESLNDENTKKLFDYFINII